MQCLEVLSEDWKERTNSLVNCAFTNKFGHSFTVLAYYRNSIENKKKFKIRFESGFETYTLHTHIKSGNIIDRLSPTVSSVGCLGYASMKDNPKEYHKWKAMLSRCYVETDKRYYTYGARGVTVCDRWLRFDFYLEDIFLIEGYDTELYNEGKLVLDKDTKIAGNKLYSLDTCKFISVEENTKYSTKRVKGRGIRVYSIEDNKYSSYLSVSAFCKISGLNRHMVTKHIDTNNEYKNFLIYTEESI